jgi:HTH-type transcriptional regulator/antitoxin HipB
VEVIHMSIGQRISERRRQLGYSQEYVAENMNVSRQAVSKWEQDLSAPDTYNLIALAELLGRSAPAALRPSVPYRPFP